MDCDWRGNVADMAQFAFMFEGVPIYHDPRIAHIIGIDGPGEIPNEP